MVSLSSTTADAPVSPRPSYRTLYRPLGGLALASALALAGCAGLAPTTTVHPIHPAHPVQAAPWPDRLHTLLPADVLLLGEQHDAADHQRLQREAVQWLALRGRLAALVLEMAERGHSTRGLPRNATEAQARTALQWNDAAWPWTAYGPVVMAAVAAGVPVLGGNLPRSQMRTTMTEAHWDRHLPAAALQSQYDALREGHCGLLPESQLAPMARIQIARDASLARTAQEAVRPGQTVLLVAGGGHVLRSLGVPTHWPADIVSKVVLAQVSSTQSALQNEADKRPGRPARSGSEADAVIETPALPPRDACAALRQQWRPAARP